MPEEKIFDYIVVGAGSAGCVLAARLSEDSAARVLLLEAGESDDADEIHIPAAFPGLFKTRWDWNYVTSEQKQLNDRRLDWPRMKALGGCSSINAMIYIRGNAADYDGWRDDHGAEGWGYEDVLPYFKRAEENTRFAGHHHGTRGPLRVEDRRYNHKLTQAWLDSAVSWGFKRNDDFNGPRQEGVGLYQVTCRNGRRWSTADAYLRPAMQQGNLTVRTGAQVNQLLLQSTRAIGVSYRRAGSEESVYADGEVILASGAINSPQVLMLSGIGPAAELRELGIDVAVDSPGVGKNLQDHPAAPLLWFTTGSSDLAEFSTPTRLAQWRLLGRGPLSSNLAESGAFFGSEAGMEAPDLQAHIAATGFYDNGLWEPAGRMFTAASTLLTPASRGEVRLRSANPLWQPEIDAAYYEDPSDLDRMLAGCRVLLDVAHQEPLSHKLGQMYWPGRRDRQRAGEPTENELVDHVRALTQTLYHPVGTCAVGTSEQAVTDPDLRVRGVEGLRVVDASVMPAITRGNTHAPTVMIAERASDLIRGRSPLSPQGRS